MNSLLWTVIGVNLLSLIFTGIYLNPLQAENKSTSYRFPQKMSVVTFDKVPTDAFDLLGLVT